MFLVIDDEPESREILSELLNIYGISDLRPRMGDLR
jgi:hypothetical protein